MPTQASILAAMYTHDIQAGDIPDGATLTVEAVTGAHGITPTTARTVLRLIAAAGFARLVPREGAVIGMGGHMPSSQHRAQQVLSGRADGRILGQTEHSTIISADWVDDVPQWVRHALGVLNDESVLARVRVTMRTMPNGVLRPLSTSTSYKPEWAVDLVPALASTDRMPTGGMRAILDGVGGTPGNGWDDVRAAFPPDHVAKLLDIDAKTPVLECSNVWLMADGTPLEVGQYWVPSDLTIRFGYPLTTSQDQN